MAAIADKLPTTAEVAEFVGKLTDSVLNPMAGTDVEHRLGVIAGMAAHGFPLMPNATRSPSNASSAWDPTLA